MKIMKQDLNQSQLNTPKKICGMAVVMAMIMLFSGCSLLKIFESDDSVKPAQTLALDGMDYFEDGNYRSALKAFQQLKDWYPFSKYAILAELKTADSHYHLEEFEDALYAYEEFKELHPRNEAIPYVIYQMGRCHFDRLDSVDRDQAPAKKAIEIFRQLIKEYPDSEYSEKSVVHINHCMKNLAGHEFYVGMFYYRIKHYKAALYRFKNIITNYPDVGIHQKALQYIAMCERTMNGSQTE